MINQHLHRNPQALDSQSHRQLKLKLPIENWSLAGKLNSMFVAAAEFGDACRDFPIVFVNAGKEDDGTMAVAPITVFGLLPNQNLFLDAAGAWRGRYIPAVLRAYPFCIARFEATRFAVCVDMGFDGCNQTEGTPLFEADGQPAQLLKDMTSHLEMLEGEIQRTRAFGRKLVELDLLREMRFDATLPDGRKHSVDGFLTIDDKKATELPAETVMELHRSGMLGLMHLHWVSLGNMRRLVEWHAEAQPAAPVAANEATTTA